jgi:uncharacterized protein (TIGR00369 family)
MAGFREHLGIEVREAEKGEARLSLRAEERHLNPSGSVHGGAIATLIDTAMGEAVAMTAEDRVPVTVEIKVNYLEPAKPGTLVATARVRRPGKRFLVLEAEVIQEKDGEHLAFATATFTTLD